MSEYPTERDDGKVLNPSTDNWVTQGYADGRGFLEEAQEYTQEHFKNQSESEEELEEELEEDVPPTTSGSLEDTGKNFEEAGIDLDDDSDDELDDMLNEAEKEFDEEFNEKYSMTEEEFMESLDSKEANASTETDETFKGVYNNSPTPSPQPTEPEETDDNSSRRKWSEKEDGTDYRYVRTPRGGMKKVRKDEHDE